MNDEKKEGKDSNPRPQGEGAHRKRRRPQRRRHSGNRDDAASSRGSERSAPQRPPDAKRPGSGAPGESRRRTDGPQDTERKERPRSFAGARGDFQRRQERNQSRSPGDGSERGKNKWRPRNEGAGHETGGQDRVGRYSPEPQAISKETDPALEALFGADEHLSEREPPHRGYEDMTEDQLTYLISAKLDDEAVLDDIPEYDFDADSTLMDIVGVKLHISGPVILFDCQNMYLDQGNKVVVETGKGLALGEVIVPGRRRLMRGEKFPRVIRKATSSDMRQQQRNEDREDAAYRLCKDRIERLGLPMKLVKVEYLHGGNKAVFYFSADGRIDFRELVRDLAQRLHTRIEMRQIGVRDASRMLGGVGACGCQLCCNLYLREFQPVSIKMAKDQNLILNPQKVSGICGRLLCCLVYEDEAYRDRAKGMPRVGRRVITPDGEGRIRDRDVLRRIVRVQLDEETAIREYPLDVIQLPGQDDGEPEPEPELKLDIPEDAGVIPEE